MPVTTADMINADKYCIMCLTEISLQFCTFVIVVGANPPWPYYTNLPCFPWSYYVSPPCLSIGFTSGRMHILIKPVVSKVLTLPFPSAQFSFLSQPIPSLHLPFPHYATSPSTLPFPCPHTSALFFHSPIP